ncbi:MAG: CARDB domain-containing protein [Candidatus Taylorbacteria bacterium]
MQDAHIKEFLDPKEPKHEEKKDQAERARNAAIKTFAVLGLAGILALVSWGVVKFAPQGIKSLTSATFSLTSKFIPNKNKLTITSDKQKVSSGVMFILSWTNRNEEKGTYSLTYPCADDFHLEAVEIQSNKKLTIPCSTDFAFASDENKITLIPLLNINQNVNVPITLNFTTDGSEKVTSSSSVTMAFTKVSPPLQPAIATSTSNALALSPILTDTPPPVLAPSPTPTLVVAPSPTPRPTPVARQPVYTYVPQPAPPREDPFGRPDLSIRILATGTVNSRNQFIEQSAIDSNERAAVRFEVQNIGTKGSGIWRFESELPTQRSYTFRSDLEPTLFPGDKIEFTLAFDEFENTSNLRFTIQVDPSDQIDELDENNNDAGVGIRVN